MTCKCGCGESFTVDGKHLGQPRKFKDRSHYERFYAGRSGRKDTARNVHNPRPGALTEAQRQCREAIGLPTW